MLVSRAPRLFSFSHVFYTFILASQNVLHIYIFKKLIDIFYKGRMGGRRREKDREGGRIIHSFVLRPSLEKCTRSPSIKFVTHVNIVKALNLQ